MLRFPLSILFLSAIIFGLGYLLGEAQPELALTLGETTVRIWFLLFIAGALFFLTLFYFLFRFLGTLGRLPEDMRQARRQGREKRAEQHLAQGLARMIEGAWAKAERHFLRAADSGSVPHVSYLLAARAALQQGRGERSQRHIRSARQHSPDHGLLADLTQAEFLLGEQDQDQALTELSHIQGQQPEQKQLNEMLLEMHTRMGNWRPVLDLAGKRGLLPRERAQTRQENAWTELLREMDNIEALEELWCEIPRAQRRRVRVVEAYVIQRLRHKSTAGCERLLRQVLRHTWDSSLVRLYGLVRGSKPARQLAWLEGQLHTHPGDAVLLLSLGRLAAREQLWDKAKTWLEASIAADPSPDTCYELSSLYRRAGDAKAAAKVLQQGMDLVVGEAERLPALSWQAAEEPKEEDRADLARRVM